MKSIVVLAAVVAVPAFAQECRIEYQRADNMWAAPGRPDGPLGTETLTLKAGERKVLSTDWKYEKRRNDGTNYYGSHVRIMRNTGQAPVELTMNGAQGLPGAVVGGVAGGAGGQVIGRAIHGLKPGESATDLRADLAEVRCAAAGASTRSGGQTPGGAAHPAQATMEPPANLSARQNSPTEIVLNWQPVPGAKEYRVYVDPPAQPQLAGKPQVVGGSGGHFVIPISRTVAPGTVYRASIEAVGTSGAVSPRVGFNAVQVQGATAGGGPAPGTGPGTSPTPSTPAGARQCPAGQFVTGIAADGALICAPK